MLLSGFKKFSEIIFISQVRINLDNSRKTEVHILLITAEKLKRKQPNALSLQLLISAASTVQ